MIFPPTGKSSNPLIRRMRLGRLGSGSTPGNIPATRFASFLILAFCLVGCATPGKWYSTLAQGRIVWRADSGNLRAEVDPARGRLSFLGPREGPNFLNSPSDPADPLQLGGHRVWLGPQTEWHPFWPPPANWEMTAAQWVKPNRGGILELETSAKSGKEIAIRRSYRWQKEGLLECKVSWQERSPRGHQSMQIFQLAKGAVFEASPKPAKSAPRGFVRLPIGPRPTTETDFALPPHATSTGKTLLLRRMPEEEKLGFPTQTLSARWPDGELRLHPGRIQGKARNRPDGPYDSQIYLGADAFPLLEFEHLSPRLVPWWPGGRVSHTVLLEVRLP